jgi:monoamine oxidase
MGVRNSVPTKHSLPTIVGGVGHRLSVARASGRSEYDMSVDGLSRRELLRYGAAAGAALVFTPSALGCSRDSSAGGDSGPRIAIVGAGLAGLTCAYRLHRRGLASSIFEANPDRIGGRCWTAREFAGSQTAEHGGEFIDSRHKRMRALAAHFGLELTDLYAVSNPGSPRLWLNGARRHRSDFERAGRLFRQRIKAAARRVGPYGYANATPAARAFDELSVADWLDRHLPGGSPSLLGQLVWAEMASEFGLDADRLSALNLFYMYAEANPGADERYHVRGGNDQVAHGLAMALPEGTIRPGLVLEALYARDDGSYGMRFTGIGNDVIADHVVLAIPFTTLRRVDLARARLSRKKRACIDELGMGTNAKVLMQFERRPQAYGDWNGYLISDDPVLYTWESSLGAPGQGSIITTYFGGRSGAGGLPAREAHAPTSKREIERNLSSLGEDGAAGLEGLRGGFNGRAWTDHWVADPWTRGSYAAYLRGQYTRYYGYVGKAEDAIHFAGEHTATTYQGFLEGAVESGERAANEIIAAG